MKITKNVTIRLVFLFAMSVLFFSTLAGAQDKTGAQNKTAVQDKITLEDIFKVWRDREKKIRTLRVKWTATITIPKKQMKLNTSGNIHNYLTHDTYIQFIISGNSVRYEKAGMEWDPIQKKSLNVSSIETINGLNRFSYSETEGKLDTRVGTKQPANLIATNIIASTNLPILMMYRIANPIFGVLDRGIWTLGPKKIIEGRKCVLVENRWNHGKAKLPYREYFFVDTERDMIPVEFGFIFREDVTLKFRVQYQKAASGDWQPANWHRDKYYSTGNKKRLKSSLDIVVTYLETNRQIPDDEFVIDFPSNTIVMDNTVKDGEENYHFVKADGSIRPITEAELSTVTSLAEIRSRLATESDRNPLFWWLTSLGVVIVLCVVLCLIYRYKQIGYIW